MSALHLTIATPTRLLVDCADVVSLRAEDESGSFGILPGHAAFLTVLPASVVRWRRADGATQVCALGAGVLSLAGNRLGIAAREAVVGADLAALADDVATMRASQTDTDRQARAGQTRLHAQAVRQMLRFLAPGSGQGGELW